MSRAAQDYSPKTRPLEHQVEATEYIAQSPTAALFDEQGLGKTKIVIDALCRSMERNEIQGVLVVVPLSLAYNWEQEIVRHSHLLPIVLRGSERERRYKLLTGANFYITNYEAVVAHLDRMKRFCRSRRVAIVLDEAARIKNPSTKTASALFELAPLAAKRIIVTGTPVANKPVDVWAQYYFLDQGSTLGDDYRSFQADYDEDSPGYVDRLAELRARISASSIRRVKSDVLELPEKVYTVVPVDLEGRQLQLYNTLRDELRIEITSLDGSRVVDESDNILKKLLRLVQLASNPMLVDRSYADVPAKFPVVEDLVNTAVSSGDKVIVWTCFVENVLLLKNRLRALHPLIIHGGIPVADRAQKVAKFQTEDKNKVLIANPAAAREGLTLTRANHAVYVDRNFNLADYLQSQDRIHRISQTKKCIVYKIIANGTVDQYVDRIIDFKADVASFQQSDSDSIQPKSMDTLFNKQTLLSALGG